MRTKQLNCLKRGTRVAERGILWLCAAMVLWLSAPASIFAAEDEVQTITGQRGTARYKAKINFSAMAAFEKQFAMSNPPPRAVTLLPYRGTKDRDPEERSSTESANVAGSGASAQSLMALTAVSPAPA